jgi:hypothetical protein
MPTAPPASTARNAAVAAAAVPDSAALERAAEARLVGQIDAGDVDFATVCAQTTDRTALLRIALLCKDPGRIQQALATIDDPSEFMQLALRSPSSRVRQLAAEQLTDPAHIRQTLRQVRDKDKSVYKILKQKCDLINAGERKAAEIATEVAALCASLERHSLKPYEPQYATILEHHSARWRALPIRPSADLEERAQNAIARGRQVIATHLREVERQAAVDLSQRLARDEAERARQAEREAALARSHTDALRRAEEAAARDAEERARQAVRAAEDQQFQQIGGLMRAANGALRDGNTQRAAGLRRAIAEKAATLVLPVSLTRQLQSLDDKLADLKQWKDFAVAPKRIELIQEMEALVGLEEKPKVLADRIRALQQEWRTINKGIVGDAQDDWERFHKASESAYEPCRVYFEAQAIMRRDNLDKRKALLDRLSAFEATQSPERLDWRLLGSVLREAPQEWRACFPVDREAGRELQQHFDRTMSRLQTLLDDWHGRNADEKRSLIDRARPLLAQADSREAIEAVKHLQAQWKNTGAARRDQDQALWNEFRELCDAIFQKRQQAYEEYNSGLEASKRQAIVLCEEAERLAASSGAELLDGAEKITDWRAAFDALDEMPRAEARGLRDRFERALDSCVARVKRQRLDDSERAYMNLFEAGRLLQAHAWAVASRTETTEPAGLKPAVEAFVATVERWPKGALQTINDTLANAGKASQIDTEAHERALRTLCIRCEILSETPTPPEDQPLRREYQVQRLMRGMGRGADADADNWDSMALEWVRSAAVTPQVYEDCRARFLRCWAARPRR